MTEENKKLPIPQKNMKGKIISIILAGAGLVIVLAVIGGGALLAGHVWNPTWNPFHQTSNSDQILRAKTKALIGR